MNFIRMIESYRLTPTGLLFFGVGGAFFTLLISCLSERHAAFFACACALFSAAVFAAENTFLGQPSEKKTFVFCLLCLYPLLYAVFSAHCVLRKSLRARRERRRKEQIERLYLLPERGNGYVRDKLRAAAFFSGETEESGGAYIANGAETNEAYLSSEAALNEGESVGWYGETYAKRGYEESGTRGYDEKNVDFSVAKKMAERLDAANLSVGDRLELNALSRRLCAYSVRKRLDAAAVRTVSDDFSALLKLSAKYGVKEC